MLDDQIGVAPMEGVTDFPMRVWLWLASQPAVMTTPFLRATYSYPHRDLKPAYAPELTALPGALPYRLTPQVMASDEEHFLRAAELIAPHAPVIELNGGCPAPTCTGRGAGSSLLKNPDDFHAFVARLTAGLGPGRLAVKMRTGYDDAAELPRLLAALEPLPLARLTLHGRTRPDRYRGHARWDLIGLAARTLPYPVIASGDVVDGATLQELRATAPRLAGVIIGRGALRHPFVFEEIRRGRAVPLPASLIPAAAAVYGLLVELSEHALERLLRLVARGLGAKPPGDDPAVWDALVMELSGALGAAPSHPRAWSELPISRNTLGRLKMLWNYQRSGLPDPCFSPRTMRSRDAGELLAAIEALTREAGAVLTPRHRPELDWLYAGERRPDAEGAACASLASDAAATAPIAKASATA